MTILWTKSLYLRKKGYQIVVLLLKIRFVERIAGKIRKYQVPPQPKESARTIFMYGTHQRRHSLLLLDKIERGFIFKT
jgi:hypothetical protein